MQDQINEGDWSLWTNVTQLDSPKKWVNVSFTPDNETNINSFLDDMTSNDFEQQLRQFHPILVVVTILLVIVTIYLFILLTLWERYGMDPMKRGIINRVSYSHFQN